MSELWPLALNRCLPDAVTQWVPANFQQIQDFTHMMLLLGVVAGCILVIRDFTLLLRRQCAGTCGQEVLDIVFLLPCTYHLLTMMGHYDDRMQTRLKEVEEKKAELTEAYMSMIADMDGMLGRAADSTAGLAEKNFAAHRRDFIKFLEGCLKRYGEAYAGCKVDEMRFVDQFRTLLRHWLKAFEEASVDPEGHPIQIEKFPNEFALYGNMKTLVEEVCDRLRQTELKMVTVRQTQDQQIVENFKTELAEHQANTTSFASPQAAISKPESSALAIPSASSAPSQQVLVTADSQQGLRELQAMTRPTTEGQECSWCTFCQPGTPCGYSTSGEDYWPVLISMSVCQMTLLCREHAQMVVGIAIGALLTIVNITSPIWGPHAVVEAIWDTLPIGIYTACLVVLVVSIERICQLLRLEREVSKLKEQREKVAEVNKDMAAFWGDVQHLTDLWLYRTIPRLDLFKEFHACLENSDSKAVVGQLRDVNNRLDQMEKAIGDLKEWRERQKAEATSDWQRPLSEGINRVIRSSQSSNLIGILTNVDEELVTGLVELPSNSKSAALPSPSGPPIFKGGEHRAGGAVELSENPKGSASGNDNGPNNV